MSESLREAEKSGALDAAIRAQLKRETFGKPVRSGASARDHRAKNAPDGLAPSGRSSLDNVKGAALRFVQYSTERLALAAAKRSILVGAILYAGAVAVEAIRRRRRKKPDKGA